MHIRNVLLVVVSVLMMAVVTIRSEEPVTSTICVPYVKNSTVQSLMQNDETYLEMQGAVQTNWDANERYIPWDKDCKHYFRAFACAARTYPLANNLSGDDVKYLVCRETCEKYVKACWYRNNGSFNPNIFWRKPAYLKKLKYFCDNHSATDSDPPCVEVYNYNEKAN